MLSGKHFSHIKVKGQNPLLDFSPFYCLFLWKTVRFFYCIDYRGHLSVAVILQDVLVDVKQLAHTSVVQSVSVLTSFILDYFSQITANKKGEKTRVGIFPLLYLKVTYRYGFDVLGFLLSGLSTVTSIQTLFFPFYLSDYNWLMKHSYLWVLNTPGYRC